MRSSRVPLRKGAPSWGHLHVHLGYLGSIFPLHTILTPILTRLYKSPPGTCTTPPLGATPLPAQHAARWPLPLSPRAARAAPQAPHAAPLRRRPPPRHSRAQRPAWLPALPRAPLCPGGLRQQPPAARACQHRAPTAKRLPPEVAEAGRRMRVGVDWRVWGFGHSMDGMHGVRL